MAIAIGENNLFEHGFVFGKYYPLHAGHMALIDYGKSLCKKLTVVVCASRQECLSSDLRVGWLKSEFCHRDDIAIIAFDYDEAELPNTSTSSWSVSEVWSGIFKGLLPDVDLVVTAEPYGDYVAHYMGICHRPYVKQVAVSASQVRADIRGCWNYLPVSVKKHYQKIVVISGTESTGKSCLASRLATLYAVPWVEEAARKIIPRSTSFSMADLYSVALEHSANICAARDTLAPLIVVGTDVYMTQSYAQHMFNKYLALEETIYSNNRADKRFYLAADAAYVQDGSRLPQDLRNSLALSHLETLNNFKQDYVLVEGTDWEHRYAQVESAVEKMMCEFS